jgi:hypothetical protein
LYERVPVYGGLEEEGGAVAAEGANGSGGSALLALSGGKPLQAADEQRRLRVLLVDGQDLIHWGFKMPS